MTLLFAYDKLRKVKNRGDTLDKYEYKVRAEEIKTLIAQGEYVEAVKIADTIDWHRVKSVMMLCTISDLYKINRRFEESKELLLLAYERHPGGRTIVYSLCELSIKMEEYVQAIEYYKEYVQIAPRDNGRYILQYKLYEAQDVSLEERIAVLEELKKRDYREKWAYELAYLYHRIGLGTKCVEECDELILWFGEGKYVIKAMELKMLHQPLSPEQEKRYELQKRGISMYSGYEQESTEEDEDEETAGKGNILMAETTRIGAIEPDDIQIKTLDMGQYNTINLQKELAASMKELLDDGTEVDESLEDESTDHITKTIIAPLFENTEELAAARETSYIQEEAVPEQEEIFFEEGETAEIPAMEYDGEFSDAGNYEYDTELSDSEAYNTEDYTAENYDAENYDTENYDAVDFSPENYSEEEYTEENYTVENHTAEVFTEEFGGIEEISDIEEPEEVNGIEETENFSKESENADTVMRQMQEEAKEAKASEGTATYQIMPEVPEALANMLAQEYDGQISLVVPEGEKVEKQITGQMSIEDILAEWERMKKDNEEKRKEDVRRHVLEQTGNIFAEFDESTKSGVLAQLEELDATAKAEEAKKAPINPHGASEEDIVEETIETYTEEDLLQEDVEAADTNETLPEKSPEEFSMEMPEELPGEPEEASQEPAPSEGVGETSQETVPLEEAKALEETLSEEQENVSGSDGTKKNTVAKEQSAPDSSMEEELEDIVDERMSFRQLTEEEKELFGDYIHTRRAKEQFIKSIDSISLAAYTGNIIVTGDDENDMAVLAKNIIREVKMTDSNFSGKVAKITGAALNKKDVEGTFSRMENGAVIIEKAAKMTEETAEKLYKYLDHENKGIIIVISGTKKEINKFLKRNDALKNCFNARFDIEALDDDALAAYGRKYAELMEYSIDELGMLALHTRISDLQTSTHVVNVGEVQEIVDEAIRHANRKTPNHFFDILIGKRYDEEDMIVLREKDFT